MKDIQNKISDERLSFYATTQPPFGYTGSDINRMARELVSLREQLAELAKQEPVSMRYRWCPPHMKEADGSAWIGEWKYCDVGMANPRKDYERQELFTRAAPPAPFVDPGLLAQFNRHRLLQIIVTGPDASGAEQNTLARIALAFYPKETSGRVADENDQ